MALLPGLKEVEARKRELLVESELNRQTLRLELEQVRLQAEKIKQTCGWVWSVVKWAPSLAGFFRAGAPSKTEAAFPQGSRASGLLRRLWGAWQRRGTKRADPRGDGW